MIQADSCHVLDINLFNLIGYGLETQASSNQWRLADSERQEHVHSISHTATFVQHWLSKGSNKKVDQGLTLVNF